MKTSPSSVPQPHLPATTHRSRWAVASASGIAIALLASSGILGIAPPVHAFSKQTRAAGATIFHEKGCEHCHGVDGVGSDRGPDLLTIGKRWHKDRIERQIREGGGGMPPFGDALHPDEVKELVDYLSARRKAPKTSLPQTTAKAPSEGAGS